MSSKRAINLSIGIPTFNRKKSLLKLLNSISDQTVIVEEILISDDDENGESIEKYISNSIANRVKYFKQKERLGLAGNFKFLLEASSQPFFIWLCDDDYLSDCKYLEVLFDDLTINGRDFTFPSIEHIYTTHKGDVKKMPNRKLKVPLSNSTFQNHFKLITESYIGYQLLGGIFKRQILISHIGFWHSTFFYPNVVGEGPFCHILFSRFKWGYCPEVAYIKDMTDSHDFRSNAIEAFWPHFWDFVGVAGVLATSQYKGYQKTILIITFFFRNLQIE